MGMLHELLRRTGRWRQSGAAVCEGLPRVPRPITLVFYLVPHLVKRSACIASSLLTKVNNKDCKKESMTTVALYAIGTSTTLESKKSHARRRMGREVVAEPREGDEA